MRTAIEEEIYTKRALTQLCETYNLASDLGRVRFSMEVATMLASVSCSQIRARYIQEAARLVNISEAAMFLAVDSARKKEAGRGE